MPKIFLILFLLAIIGGCGFWIYKNYFSSFAPDVNEMQMLPPDVTQLENKISQDPKFELPLQIRCWKLYLRALQFQLIFEYLF
jgi:hypothetical protein